MIQYSHKATVLDTMNAWSDKKVIPTQIKELVEQHPDIGSDVVATDIVMCPEMDTKIADVDNAIDYLMKVDMPLSTKQEDELKELKLHRQTLSPKLISCTLSARINVPNWVGDYSVWHYRNAAEFILAKHV